MWNYRIIKDKNTYGLYEVMYNDDGEIFAHSEEPEIVGEVAKDLLVALELMIHDVNKHIIDGKEILEIDKIKFAKPCEDFEKSEAITYEEFKKTLDKLE